MSSPSNGDGLRGSQHGQPSARPRIGIAGNAHTRRFYLDPEDLRRLQQVGDVVMIDYDVPVDGGMSAVPEMPEIEDDFVASVSGLDVLILGHGSTSGHRARDRRGTPADDGGRARRRSPRGSGRHRGSRRAGVTVVDTTNAASAPVAEWALALALLGLRQHGRFRDIISGQQMSYADYKTDPPGRELTGKRVGMIGFGHIAWRLMELLRPFEVSVVAYDPYAPRELANALAVDFAPLDTVMGCDVVFCMVPATPTTKGMIGVEQFARLPRDGVFINVARGQVVDLDALVAKARLGDAWFGIDVHDPEPIAVDSPLIGLRNVFLSPHIAGNTVEGLPRFFGLMVDEVIRHLAGIEPRAMINDRVVAHRAT